MFARFYFGLGKLPVYVESKEFEYIYAPNQHIKRFGNRIITNEYSMRSLPLSGKDKIRILKFGDSIINGGSQTDNDSLASTILEDELTEQFHSSIRVLNVGANSWGPDNAFAYLNKYGNFNASMIVLVFSSHDLYDNMHHQKVVGVHPAWPKEQPFSAVTDGFFKYLIPWIKSQMIKDYNKYSYLGGDIKSASKINSGWYDFINYCKDKNIELLVYLHAERTEALNKKYNSMGEKIIQMLNSDKVKHILGIDHTLDETYYRDFIHLNNKGQKKLAEALEPEIKVHIKKKLNEKRAIPYAL